MPVLDSFSGGGGLASGAALLYVFQISAGGAPPCCGSPWTLVIGTRFVGGPRHTPGEKSEFEPSSHPAMSSLVVPVFAAVGQLITDLTAVPPSTFWCRMLVSSPVTASLRTLTRWGWPQLLSTRPPGNTTLVIAIGELRQPPSASVANTSAISSG